MWVIEVIYFVLVRVMCLVKEIRVYFGKRIISSINLDIGYLNIRFKKF